VEAPSGVIETEVPTASVISRDVVEAAYFRDSYRSPLRDPDRDMVAIYAGIFAHHPLAFKLLLILRNGVARLCGLEIPSLDEILRPRIQGPYAVGDKIGPWSIFAMTENEIVAGRDNNHMDFRLSVLRGLDGHDPSVTVSTICTTHNLPGRLYMNAIEPFHRMGVKTLMARARAAGRI
jgi:hypothetical protein